MDDEGLAAGFRSGEPAAIRAVYRRYAGAVFTVAMSMLGDRERAEDAVQITFLKAWQASPGVDGSRVLAPWLYTIARRVAIDLIRSDRRAARSTPLLDHEAVTEPPSFETIWEHREIRAAVDSLPPAERDVVQAQHYLGLSHAQIANLFRMPIGTVKSRSHRALRRLAEPLRHLSPSPASPAAPC